MLGLEMNLSGGVIGVEDGNGVLRRVDRRLERVEVDVGEVKRGGRGRPRRPDGRASKEVTDLIRPLGKASGACSSGPIAC